MATRTAVLARGNVTVTTNVVIATVPAGHIWIIKNVAQAATGGVSTNTRLYAQSADGTVQTEFVGGVLGAFGIQDTLNLFVVLGPGDELIFNITAGSISYWISGADLFVSTN